VQNKKVNNKNPKANKTHKNTQKTHQKPARPVISSSVHRHLKCTRRDDNVGMAKDNKSETTKPQKCHTLATPNNSTISSGATSKATRKWYSSFTTHPGAMKKQKKCIHFVGLLRRTL